MLIINGLNFSSLLDTNLKAHEEMMSQLPALFAVLEKAACVIASALKQQKKVLFMGNGGSASDAQHLAAELVGRFYAERRALAGIALNTDTSLLTSVGNDYGFDSIFFRQIEALCQPGDVVVGLSTSGNSPNVLKAMALAKEIGAFTIGFTGKSGGKLASIVDLLLNVPSEIVPRIQEAHIFLGHNLCELIEKMILDEADVSKMFSQTTDKA